MMIQRILFFIGIFLLSIFVTPFIFLPLVVLYVMRWFAPEILVTAYFIDVYFGAAGDWPLYIIGAFLMIIFAEAAKKYLMIQ